MEGRLTFVFGVESHQPSEQAERRHLVMGGEKFEKNWQPSGRVNSGRILISAWFGVGWPRITTTTKKRRSNNSLVAS